MFGDKVALNYIAYLACSLGGLSLSLSPPHDSNSAVCGRDVCTVLKGNHLELSLASLEIHFRRTNGRLRSAP